VKPVVISAIQEAPVDSYVSFNSEGAKDEFESWKLEIRDEQGIVQTFGPYTQEKVSIPGKSILGSRKEGNFNVLMVGKLKNGKTIEKETPVHMVLWTPPVDEQGMRFSVVYEFNESDVITLYEKYLTEIVTPKIPNGSLVIIHGHTDIIGSDEVNNSLSSDRANDVKSILEKSLAKAGKNNVAFDVKGYGEDDILSPFDNKLPEERFYNRTVIIDIIPKK
jgi:outer membrane protein OmpA-like peptidoglycan-associated protein